MHEAQPPVASPEVAKPDYEIIRDWAELDDPLNALRFRLGVEKSLREQGESLPSETRRHFRAWGVGPSGPDAHAIATYLGLSDEEWSKRVKDEDFVGDGDAKTGQLISTFNLYLKNPNLVEQVRRAHPDVDINSLQPMRVATQHDKYLALSNEALDQEVRLSTDPQQKMSILTKYLIPRVDEQYDVLRDSTAGDHDKNLARAVIQDIEDRFEQIGVQRIPAIANMAYDANLHQIVGQPVGNGPIWLVSGELKPGYGQANGKGHMILRKASVSVERVSKDELQRRAGAQESQKQERQRRRAAAQQAGRQATGASGNFDPSTPSPYPPAAREDQAHAHGRDKYDRQLELIKRYEQDSELGHLFDPDKLRTLHDQIQQEAWPQYKARLDELNADLSDDNKIPTVGRMPIEERRKIVDPISNAHTRAYAGADIHLSDEAIRALTLARLKAAGKLRRPEAGRQGSRRKAADSEPLVYQASTYTGDTQEAYIVDAEVVD